MTPHDKSTTSRSWVLRLTAVAAIVASLGFGATTRAHADNNSGTVKLSQDGIYEAPSGGSNEPKLCLPFYVQGYNLNPSQSYTVKFFYQGSASGTYNGQLAGSQTTATDANGYFNATITSNSLTLGPSPYGAQLSETGASSGHYKVSVFDGTTELTGAKDKSKVFKIDCGGGGGVVGGATPELGSGELLATGLLPIGAILFYRRRRNRRAS